MEIKPVCSDSMGVRSMATLVETRDVRLMIDPAAAVAPRRYGLPPHRRELELLEAFWRKIASAAEDCEVVAVTHYHYDHHSSSRFLQEIYGGRIVIVKDPENMINFSQRRRAQLFLEKIRPIAARVMVADGREYVFGGTRLVFSNNVPHGSDSKLGYVVELYVRDSSGSFLFTSDVQGFPLDSQARFALENKPDVMFIDGPSTYMLGVNYTHEELETCLRNMRRIVGNVLPLMVLLDHHPLRDLQWKSHFKEFLDDAGKLGVIFKTVAEYKGMKMCQLEAMRENLFKNQGNLFTLC
ncbi:MAG: MBL fold metallo-hydrolase [Thermoproteota archaeon]